MQNANVRKGTNSLTFWLQWISGLTLTIGLLVLLTYLKTGEFDSQYRLLAILTVFVSLPLYAGLKLYQTLQPLSVSLPRLLLGWLALLGVLIALGFVAKVSASFSREVLLTWAVTGFVVQMVSFLILRLFAIRHYRRTRNNRRALIVGTGELAQELAEKIHRLGNEPIIGYVAESKEDSPQFENGLPVLGQLVRLRGIIADQNIQRVYIALPAEQTEQIEGLYIDLLDANVDIVWVPDLANFLLLNHSVSNLGGLPAIYLNESPLTSYPTSALMKAAMDRTAALIGIMVLSPLLAAVAIAIKLTSPGPIIFRQPRHGWNGQVFEVWKFRSMRIHEDTEVKQATRNDSRVTPIGRFIRRTSIDELPQLFNVLKGEMSLVGPRPHAVQHNDYYSDKVRAYMVRHRIKPGITGLAQISGFRGETDTLDKMEKRVEIDLDYINNWSFWLDLKILIKTPFTLFSRGVY